MIFIDTNYLLRFLLKDIDSQYLEAKKLLLQAARGEKKVITSTIVFFELFWVLKSYYKKDKTEKDPEVFSSTSPCRDSGNLRDGNLVASDRFATFFRFNIFWR